MKNGINMKTSTKIIGIILLTFFGGINCIALYLVGKKLHSHWMKVSGCILFLLIAVLVWILSFVDSQLLLWQIAVKIIGIVIIIPSLLVLIRLDAYRKACIKTE